MAWDFLDSLRPAGGGLGHGSASDVAAHAVSNSYHYLSLSIDRVFLRNLPGFESGAPVVLGVEVAGIYADGKSLKTLLEPVRSHGENAELLSAGPLSIGPFLYTGRNISLTIQAKQLSEPDALKASDRIARAASMLRWLNPMAEMAVNTAKSLYTSFFGAFRKLPLARWKYELILYPPDTVHAVRPERLLLAGQHVFVALAHGAGRRHLRAITPEVLMTRVRLAGNRLVWKDGGADYLETPYFVVNVTRYKRYPSEDTDLRKIVRQVESLYETGAYDRALEQLRNVGAAIAEDKIITQEEKNLERALMEVTQAKIEAAMSGPQKRRAALAKWRSAALRVKSLFKGLLEPAEVRKLDFEVSRLDDMLR